MVAVEKALYSSFTTSWKLSTIGVAAGGWWEKVIQEEELVTPINKILCCLENSETNVTIPIKEQDQAIHFYYSK